MSKDQMTDVFPIQFDFKEGEQPTATKLNGIVNFTDTAFSKITQAVGDPWDATSHLGDLSLEKLAQSSIARIIGPSDYISPLGGCWNEQMSTSVDVTLVADKNSWTLGYPLVKLTSPVSEKSKTVSSFVTHLTWGTDITVTVDTSGILTDRKSSAEDVVEDGDFFVDFYTGTITAYSSSSNAVTLTINNLYMLGAGVPWGTHNVIPTWEETSALCNLGSKVNPGDGTSRYVLTLPTVSASQRYESSTIRAGKKSESISDYDSQWSVSQSNSSSDYRLPSALISNYSSGDEIPEGYVLLYDTTLNRVVPNSLITFFYLNENSLTVVSSEDYLTTGANYRIFVSGTSLAEAVSHLLQVQRNNNHVGLTANPTISYTSPLSHDNLDNLYSGTLDASSSSIYRFKFTKSNYPTNPHPQYLHRYGWMTNDQDGNSGNAMRGNLVFSESDSDMNLAYGSSASRTKTYGIMFGGGTDQDALGNTIIRYNGGEDISTWAYAYPHRLPMKSEHTGGANSGTYYGGLYYKPWYGTPLYLQGDYTVSERAGAMLGFDYGMQNELNFIKLMPAYRTTTDPELQCANTGQTNTLLNILPNVSSFNRVSEEQFREFRFRGGAYVSGASNTSNTIGNDLSESEFNHTFISPSVVGADFINIYSNAIFFSDTGDGTRTSFTTNANSWIANADSTSNIYRSYDPTGIYFSPFNGSEKPHFSFVVQGSGSYPDGEEVLAFGYDYGFQYHGESFDSIVLGGYPKATGYLLSSAIKTNLSTSTNIFDMTAAGGIGSYAYGGHLTLLSYGTSGSAAADIGIQIGSYTETNGGDIGEILIKTGVPSGVTGVTPASNKGKITIDSTYVLDLLSDNTLNIESRTGSLNIDSASDLTIDSATRLFLDGEDYIRLKATGDEGYIYITTDTNSSSASTNGNIYLTANGTQGKVRIQSAENHHVEINAKGGLDIDSAEDVEIDCTGHCLIEAGDYFSVSSGATMVFTPPSGDFRVTNVQTSSETPLTISSSGRLYKQTSSLRYKEDISYLQSVPSWIYSLDLVSFKYKNGNVSEYGFIAEDLVNKNKDLVILSEEGEPDGVRYNSIFSALVKAVQEQKKEIDLLKEQLAGK